MCSLLKSLFCTRHTWTCQWCNVLTAQIHVSHGRYLDFNILSTAQGHLRKRGYVSDTKYSSFKSLFTMIQQTRYIGILVSETCTHCTHRSSAHDPLCTLGRQCNYRCSSWMHVCITGSHNTGSLLSIHISVVVCFLDLFLKPHFLLLKLVLYTYLPSVRVFLCCRNYIIGLRAHFDHEMKEDERQVVPEEGLVGVKIPSH